MWTCYRSKAYIFLLSLVYVIASAAAIIFAITHNMNHGIIFYVLAALVVLISLWRINRVHYPVALICEKKASRGHSLVFPEFGLLHFPESPVYAGGLQRSGRRLRWMEPNLYRCPRSRRYGSPAGAAGFRIVRGQALLPELGGTETGREPVIEWNRKRHTSWCAFFMWLSSRAFEWGLPAVNY